MPDVYTLRESRDRDAEDTRLYDVAKNGISFLTPVPYTEAIDRIVALIADDDRYQEVRGGELCCDISGQELKNQGNQW